MFQKPYLFPVWNLTHLPPFRQVFETQCSGSCVWQFCEAERRGVTRDVELTSTTFRKRIKDKRRLERVVRENRIPCRMGFLSCAKLLRRKEASVTYMAPPKEDWKPKTTKNNVRENLISYRNRIYSLRK